VLIGIYSVTQWLPTTWNGAYKPCRHYTGLVEIHFSPEVQAKLDSAAAEIHCRPDEYVQRLVEEYVDYDAWFRGKVGRSLERRDCGEFLSAEQVSANTEKLLDPQCRSGGLPTRQKTPENPSAARRIAETINERANALARSPYVGRLGRVEGTRELALPPLPYLTVYRVMERAGAVEIVNVIHGARRWP
jgi:toxin ParE1/3/4